jgi:hypothetical protein
MEGGQTIQWPKEEGQTIQWPEEERQTIQWPQDTKGVVRSCKWKKDRQYNGRKIPKE